MPRTIQIKAQIVEGWCLRGLCCGTLQGMRTGAVTMESAGNDISSSKRARRLTDLGLSARLSAALSSVAPRRASVTVLGLVHEYQIYKLSLNTFSGCCR
eukprot:4708548-Pleurochrysis_carterae.AAC.1